MSNIEDNIGKTLALVIWNLDKDNDVRVFKGIIVKQQDEFIFYNQDKSWKITINDTKLEEIRITPEKLKTTLLEAEFYLNMTISDVEDSENYINTNLKWEK